MKNLLKSTAFLAVLFSFSIMGCQNDNSGEDLSKLTPIAKPITTTCLIQNDDPSNDWQEECFKNIDVQKLASFIFDGIYAGKFTAYDYVMEKPMTIEEVKALEAKPEYNRKLIGKALFTEDWYIDKDKLQMVKKVNSIMLAYQIISKSGEVQGHKSGVLIYLNGTAPK